MFNRTGSGLNDDRPAHRTRLRCVFFTFLARSETRSVIKARERERDLCGKSAAPISPAIWESGALSQGDRPQLLCQTPERNFLFLSRNESCGY